MNTTSLKSITSQDQQPQQQRQPRNIFDVMQSDSFKRGVGAVVGKVMTPDRMISLCINAVKKTPLLMQCDPNTVLGALMASAALGLEPNTVQQQAFLIPYKKRIKVGPGKNDWADAYDCQFQIGARGFVTLIYRSPEIKRLTAETVHEHDLFEHMQGSEAFLRFAKSMRDRGDPIGAFSHVMLKSGEESACILPLDEIHKIRSKSETYNSLAGKVAEENTPYNRKRLDETPWVLWFDDMASKSAIKKHAKVLPISGGGMLAAASELDNKADMGAIDLRTFTDPDAARAVVDGEMDVPEARQAEAPAALEAPQAPVVDMSQMAVGRRAQVAVPATYAVEQEPQQQRQQQAEPPTFDPDAFADRMQGAADKNDLESLDLMADELRSVKDADAQETLRTMYQRLRAEVEDRQAGGQGQGSLIAPPPASPKRGKAS